MDLTTLTITQVHKGLKDKKFSSLELTKAYLDKIKQSDKDISAYLYIAEKSAIEQAKKNDELISKNGQLPLLAAVPCAVKDNILIEGEQCTAGSKILENYIAPYDAGVIKKLKKQGTVFLGKTNLDEFAMGSSTENSAFGPTKNPCDLERVPGGSSGGSAAAVAAKECVFALGSDTGGSIRLPASFCGVVGLKPTYGAVSRYGLIAFASSLDQIGPITKTVEDAKIVFRAIRGRDEMDSTSVEISPRPKAQGQKPRLKAQNLKKIKIGVPKEYFVKGMDPEVEKIVRGAIKQYEQMGAKIEEISLPHTKYALPVYYIISPSEASANLARFDGIRYGYSEFPNQDNLLDVYLQTRGKGFGREVRRRIMLGIYALSAGYYDAYYLKAQRVRTKIIEDFNKAFQNNIDVIMTPVSPTTAFKLGEKIDDPITMYLSDIFTISANLAGLPALSLPCGKVDNLPVGLQLIGDAFEEEKILDIAQVLESRITNYTN